MSADETARTQAPQRRDDGELNALDMLAALVVSEGLARHEPPSKPDSYVLWGRTNAQVP